MTPAIHDKEIRTAITTLWASFRGGDDEWTRATFEVLRDLGSRFGYDSLYSQKCGGPGEWLWDFVWCERDATGNIVSMPLAAESEWGKSTLRRDFEKLLVADAPFKVIITQRLTENQLKDTIAELKGYSATYHGKPASYLAAGWAYGGTAPHPYFESWATAPEQPNRRIYRTRDSRARR